MHWTFRRLLTALALFLALVSTVVMAYFFINFYRRDKIAQLFEYELINTKQLASRLERLIELGAMIDLEKIQETNELAFLFEDPCNRASGLKGGGSSAYREDFKRLKVDPKKWTDTLAVHQACKTAVAAPFSNAPRILSSDEQISFPYILVLLSGRTSEAPRRIVMIPMQSLHSAVSNTLFLLDGSGRRVWAADGEAYVQTALSDTGVDQRSLERLARYTFDNGAHSQWLGSDGLASFVPVANTWVLVSLSYGPAVLNPVNFVFVQFVILGAGIVLLVFLLGKVLAAYLIVPLQALRATAERIGSGDLDTALPTSRIDEFSSVHTAINVMVGQIRGLLAETQHKTKLEAELKLAQQVQRLLLPATTVQLDDHQFFSHCQSAEFVGGDWWGYVPIPIPGRKSLVLVLIGDATDHGTPSALVAATVRGAESLISCWVEENPRAAEDPSNVLSFLNRTVYDAAKGSIGMTMFAAVMDIQKGLLYCANAGHQLPYLLNSGGAKSIGRSGIPLGDAPDTVYQHVDVYPWTPGDRLFLFSDGLVDCPKDGKNMFARKDLQRFLKSAGGAAGHTLLEGIVRHRTALISGAKEVDDVTIVVCEARRHHE